MFTLDVTRAAAADIQSAYDWWRANRSVEQADRWYTSILAAIQRLSDTAERCGIAPETDLLSTGIRQLAFGVGRRRTHRILFTIEHTTVVVLRVRHASQATITELDLQ